MPFGSPYPGMCGRLALGLSLLAGTLVATGKEFLREKRIVQPLKALRVVAAVLGVHIIA